MCGREHGSCDNAGSDDGDEPAIEMVGVRNYGEGDFASLCKRGGRWAVYASCQGGFDGTLVDLEQLISWLRSNKPELLA